MTYLDASFNGWINQQGELRPIPPGCHAANRNADEHIRISTPEGRRVAMGITVDDSASDVARREAKRICRLARRYDIDIIAESPEGVIYCGSTDRPTALNRMIIGGENP